MIVDLLAMILVQLHTAPTPVRNGPNMVIVIIDGTLGLVQHLPTR